MTATDDASPPARGNGDVPGGALGEFGRFVRAALIVPVPRGYHESDALYRRRRIVSAVTLVVGAVVLSWGLRIQPGDPMFYAATLGLAAVWAAGALASGPLHLGHGHTRHGGSQSRAVVQSLCVGALLLALFCAGAVIVARIPVLRDPVQELLDHARFGSIVVVALITAVNGIAEEMFFRGALYAAVGRWRPVPITAAIYTAITLGAGIPLLAFAALILGVVTGLQRRVTGGILGPTITHLVWSLGMLGLLPPLLDALS